MDNGKSKHFTELSLDAFTECVEADPKVPYTADELEMVLRNLVNAVVEESYITATPTVDNPALSDDYVFDSEDKKTILKSIGIQHFVGKIVDVGKGAVKRRKKGFPQEYLYVFQYPCRLCRRDAQEGDILSEDVLIYIKINNRKIPYEKVIVISFHKNRPRKN